MSDTRTVGAAAAASATPALLERSSWGSIFAGAIIALAVLTVLNLIGLAFGLYVIDAGEPALGAEPAAWTMGLWWIASTFAALFLGGWVAGRLAGNPSPLIACLHGMTVWALATLLGIWAISSMTSRAFSGAAGMVGQATQATTQGGAMALSSLDPVINFGADAFATELREEGLPASPQQVQQAVRATFNQAISPAERAQLETLAQQALVSAVQNPGAAGAQFSQLMNQAFGANGVIGPEDREQAISALAQQLGTTEAQIRTVMDRWQQEFLAGDTVQQNINALQAEAAQITAEAANTVADTAMWTAAGLILALAAAALGGVTGGPSLASAYFVRRRPEPARR